MSKVTLPAIYIYHKISSNILQTQMNCYESSQSQKTEHIVLVTQTMLTHLCQPVRSTFAVRETASLGIMGAPRVTPLNPSVTIVLSEH